MDFSIIIASFAKVTLLISMVLELAKCFFGYRLKKVLTAINGFLMGFAVGSLFVSLFFSKVLGDNFLTVLLISAFVVGAIGALVSFFCFKIGVFIYTFYGTFSFVYPFLESMLNKTTLNSEIAFSVIRDIINGDFVNIQWAVLLPSLLIAVLIGIITIKYLRTIIISVTSVTGGIAFSSSLMTGFLGITTPYVVMTVATVFVIMGLIVQFKTTKKHR